jgi:SagB-type dehydrogenase family enzyme
MYEWGEYTKLINEVERMVFCHLLTLSSKDESNGRRMENCSNCTTPGVCGQCLKGGFPMRKELTTFLALLFFSGCVILFILLVNAKRQALQASRAQVIPQTSSAPQYQTATPAPRTYSTTIPLPVPKVRGTVSVEQAINERRSRREFTDQPVTISELGQMLWAGQGITDVKEGKRTAPSAREVYPITLFVVVRNVTGIAPGLYEYLPATHALGNMNLNGAGDLLNGAGVQAGAQKSPIVFLLSAAYGKGAESMKAGAKDSALIETGHIAQNMYLEAEGQKLGMVVMGGFDAKKVGEAMKLDPAQTVVYVAPMGHPAPEVSATPAVKGNQ